VPQRWQNFAPGVSGTRQVEQTAPSSGAPQLAQKRPEAGAEQLGQVVEGEAGGVVDDMTCAFDRVKYWREIYIANGGRGTARGVRLHFDAVPLPD